MVTQDKAVMELEEQSTHIGQQYLRRMVSLYKTLQDYMLVEKIGKLILLRLMKTTMYMHGAIIEVGNLVVRL
jgi:uncharacterized protein YbcC (UPF0753/DUF2309 family)